MPICFASGHTTSELEGIRQSCTHGGPELTPLVVGLQIDVTAMYLI